MAEISRVRIPGSSIDYGIKDAPARERITNLETSLSSALVFKGVVGSAAEVQALTNYKKGWCWKASAAFEVPGIGKLESGDMLVAIEAFVTAFNPADFSVIQNNTDDFVGATDSTDGARGLVIAPKAGDNTKYLKGDGTWAPVNAVPPQAGHSGEYLSTNGTDLIWDKPIISPTAIKAITGDGTTKEFEISHGLNTKDLIVEIYDMAGNNATIVTDVERTDNTKITVKFKNAPASGAAYRVIMLSLQTASTVPNGEGVEF